MNFMKKLPLGSLKLDKEILDTVNGSVSKAVQNIFSFAVNKKFERGMTIEQQRVYFKTFDKLVGLEVDLEDTEFDFLYKTLTEAELPPLRTLIALVDFIEEIKAAKS